LKKITSLKSNFQVFVKELESDLSKLNLRKLVASIEFLNQIMIIVRNLEKIGITMSDVCNLEK